MGAASTTNHPELTPGVRHTHLINTIGTDTTNLKVLAASLLFIAIMAAAIPTNFSGFIDAISATFVLVGALCLGIYANGEWKSDARLNAFSEGQYPVGA